MKIVYISDDFYGQMTKYKTYEVQNYNYYLNVHNTMVVVKNDQNQLQIYMKYRFITEKEYHDMKFNSKLDEIL